MCCLVRGLTARKSAAVVQDRSDQHPASRCRAAVERDMISLCFLSRTLRNRRRSTANCSSSCVRGVRSSWETMFRNADLALDALSAVCATCISSAASRSLWLRVVTSRASVSQVFVAARDLSPQEITRSLDLKEVGGPRLQLIGGERLNEVVLGLPPQQPDAQRFVGPRLQHHDGSVGQIGAFAHFRDHSFAAHARHHDIGQNQVRGGDGAAAARPSILSSDVAMGEETAGPNRVEARPWTPMIFRQLTAHRNNPSVKSIS